MDRGEPSESEVLSRIRACAYGVRPFGTEAFAQDMAKRFDRRWNRGRPSDAPADIHGRLCDEHDVTARIVNFAAA